MDKWEVNRDEGGLFVRLWLAGRGMGSKMEKIDHRGKLTSK